MHFTTALVAALSISASTTSAIPLRHAHPGASAQALLSRNAEGHLVRRNVEALVARGVGLEPASAKEGRAIIARYAHITNDGERSMAVVRDLHRRGILDMLVAAIRDIIVELLGSGGMARRQEGKDDESHDDLVQGITCLINQMVGVDGGAKCSSMMTSTSATNATASANATSAATAATSSRPAALDTSSPEKTKASLAKLLSQVGAALEDNGSAKSNSTEKDSHKSKDSKKKDAAQTSSLASLPPTATASASSTQQTPADATKIWARDLDLMARQEGVEGLLQVLRSLVDAILNTLLPMSSRDEDSSSSSASSSSFGKNCPPPQPNDGQYRPGCPGYGRRSSIPSDVVMSQRDASALQSLLPLINMLIENLPSLLQQGTASSTGSSKAKAAAATATSTDDGAAALASLLGLSSSAPASAPAATATGAAKKQDSAGSASSESVSSSSSASTPKSTSKADKEDKSDKTAGPAPISAAKLSIESRDLLDADGFEMSKRYDNGDDNNSQDGNQGGIQISALNDVLNNLLGSHVSRRQNNQGGGSSQDGNQGGIQVSLLDNLLNGVLGGLLGGNGKEDTTGSASAAKSNSSSKSAATDAAAPSDTGNNAGGGSSQDGNSNGINVSILNDVLNGLLGGLLGGNSRRDASQNGNQGGINIQLLNGLLNNLLGSHARRAIVTMAARSVLEARADFAPVWTEIKKLGNSHFNTVQRRDANEDFAPVWSSFRDMVDAAYSEADANAAAGVKRSPIPTVDTKPFAQATSKFIKQKFFSVKRSQQDFAPVLNAAGEFAKTQMKEWTAALNAHAKAH